MIKILYNSVMSLLHTFSECERQMLNLRLVYTKRFKDMDSFSIATYRIMPNLFKRAAEGYNLGNIYYVYNRQSMRGLLKTMVENGVIA